ncbi:hypothetical protein BGX26_007353, partial [Mortierella sp. AD094]
SIPAGTPLFSSLLNYRHNKAQPNKATEDSGNKSLGGQERTNYPFVISVDDGGNTLRLTAQVIQQFDSHRICGYMQKALESLADALEQTPDMKVRELEILPNEERETLLESWNDTTTTYPQDHCIHQLFQNQAEQTPDAIALVYDDENMTYRELNAWANRRAIQLKEIGVKSGDFVAIIMERSFELVITQIATLKIGAAYVPVDPKAPADRQIFIVNDCRARIIVSGVDTQVPENLEEIVLRVTGSYKEKNIVEAMEPITTCSSLDIAYAMYTSGSTGTPKGVLVPHRAIARLTINNGYANLGSDDCVAFISNPAFDASTFEIWSPLLNGGCVAIIDTDVVTDPYRLAEAINRYSITAMWLTAALFNQYVLKIGSTLAKLTYLLCGGEQETIESFITLLKYGSPKHLIHGYGPTETTTFATTYEITKIEPNQARLPIGRPISNTTTYVLDESRQPVPLGVVGELYIGGAGVANGYLNRPELTIERFLPDPFSKHENAKMYRTGDLVRQFPDGNLLYFGRNDHQ